MSIPPPPQGGQPPLGPPGQLPYGQPYSGQAPPQASPYGYPYPGPAPHPAPPPQRRRTNPSTVIGIVCLVLGIAFTGTMLLIGGDGEPTRVGRQADVGECLENRGTRGEPSLFVIDCDADKAEYRLVERLSDPGSDGKCPAGVTRYEESRNGRVTMTLCLAPADSPYDGG
ncbi:LppU/SCO3897 family protein [Streptomyces boluensis]|uniref:Uncharacterized protein n=1 Tax=Streptomyces boluensis TaxID=1775135 RepID=A0A964V0U5_9ACTN|nr:hypothetical protein [Streptomyces boluensis]NBE55050.1 hypothetical protein [Streptomyces boluensis]